jgi:predicted O-methyltransferase YrrM
MRKRTLVPCSGALPRVRAFEPQRSTPSLQKMDRTQIALDERGRVTIDDVEFLIDLSSPGRPSETGSFTIAKSEPYIRFYEALARSSSPEGVLELGIYRGGSYVLLDKLFSPRRMSAVELSADPIAPLMNYVDARRDRHAHFATSQSDDTALRRIVNDDLGGTLDVVVDDASHSYAPTRRSFEILFPLLSPGGVYIIEDWSWAHHPSYQSMDAPFAEEPALTNLLVEQILLLASTGVISEIRIKHFLYLIRKAAGATVSDFEGDLWTKVLARGRALSQL